MFATMALKHLPRPAILACLVASCPAFLQAAVQLPDSLIPASRVVDWTPGVTVGVPGGIPNRTTIFTNLTGIDATGATDVQPAIQAAVNACPSNQVVLLPAGRFRLDSPVFYSYLDGITVRGAGIGQTIIDWRSTWGSAFHIGGDADYLWNSPNTPVVGGLQKGSSNIVLSAAGPLVGDLAQISQENQPDILHTDSYGRMLRQKCMVVGVSNGTNLTIWPPLMWDFQTNLVPKIAIARNIAKFDGLEDLEISATNSTSPRVLTMSQAYGSWFKNVKVTWGNNFIVNVENSTMCEIRGSWISKTIGGVAPNHSGLIFTTSSGCLIEDNIIDDVFPDIEVNAGSCGNVFDYNFLNATYWGGTLDANHNPHNHHNLYEGNVGPNFQSDGYYGSDSDETLFRNWFHTQVGGGIWAVKLDRFAYRFSLLANVFGTPGYTNSAYGLLSLGKPNMGNEDWTGFGPPWNIVPLDSGSITMTQTGTPTVVSSAPIFYPTNIYWFILPDDGNLVQIQSVIDPQTVSVPSYSVFNRTNLHFILTPGPSGWQECDTNVQTTAIFKGNYYCPVTVATPDKQWPKVTLETSLGSSQLPPSLLYTNQPTWWPAGKRWPAVAPELSPMTVNIPAQDRYLGITVANNDTTAPTQPLNATAVVTGSSSVSVSWTASTDNVGVAGYYIERSQGVGSTGFVQIGSSLGTSYTDSGLSASTVYNYRVRAYDAAGNLSDYSAVVTVTTGSSTTVAKPAAPADLLILQQG